jgi:hypothetical protein
MSSTAFGSELDGFEIPYNYDFFPHCIILMQREGDMAGFRGPGAFEMHRKQRLRKHVGHTGARSGMDLYVHREE